MIIDEKGRLFGLINVFDLFVLVALVIAIYLGGSALIAVRQKPLEIVSITPGEATAGQAVQVELQITNRKLLRQGQVRLIPVDFQGETLQYNTTSEYGVRDHVSFTVPPDIRPGRYRVELELTVQDNFRRNSILLAQPEDRFFTLTPPVQVEAVEKSFWQIAAEAFFPAADAARLDSATEYRDSSGLFKARVEKLGPRTSTAGLDAAAELPSGEGRLASLRFFVPFADLEQFQAGCLGAGSRIVLETAQGRAMGWMTGRGELKPELAQDRLLWEMDFLLLVYTAEQRAAITAGARQNDDKGELQAEVVQVLGEEPTAWIATTPAAGPAPSNLRVRMRLLCSLQGGRLSWHGQTLEPQAIISFEFAGQKVTGTLVAEPGGVMKLQTHLLFPVVTSATEKNLRAGAFLLDPASRKPCGVISRVIGSAAAEAPEAFLDNAEAAERIGRQYRQVLVLASLDCNLQNNGLFLMGQPLAKNSPLTFNVFSEQLQARLSDSAKLPPHPEPVWITADVRFNSLDPLIAEMLEPGSRDLSNPDRPELELESIVCNSPAKVLLSGPTAITITEHPILRDIQARVRIRSIRRGEQYFFRGSQLLIGSGISLRFNKYAVSGTITGF